MTVTTPQYFNGQLLDYDGSSRENGEVPYGRFDY
jgi:hypothetical protein